jgi:hypothetical protein
MFRLGGILRGQNTVHLHAIADPPIVGVMGTVLATTGHAPVGQVAP